ncbi:MAG: XRE family transcriptional regulator [Roseiarcus sp.]
MAERSARGIRSRGRPEGLALRPARASKGGVDQRKGPALAHYKLDGFSVERLMVFLTALDQDVEIVIRKKPRSRAAARISVVAA